MYAGNNSIPGCIGSIVGLPFEDEHGVRAQRRGNYVVITTNFGLRLEFDGVWTSFVYICDSYAGHVCGLCGNADGNRNSDFVDRQNNLVNTNGNYFTRFYKWGSSWRVSNDDDSTVDIDGKA